MGLFDNLLGGALGKTGSQGGLSQPLMMALMALLASANRQSAAGHAGMPQAAPSPASTNPLGDLLGGLMGGGGAASPSSPGGGLAGGLLGGLGAILDQFQQAGQKDTVDSWIGTSQNRQISPSQLGSALDPAVIRQLSEQSGMDPGDVLNQLSEGLPNLVDRLTPRGRLPANASEVRLDELSRLSDQLR
jgi:uncharacterized protein YidB (DUF937 family)